MRGDPVEATNHVARHCTTRNFDSTTNELTATAFELRDDEESVSVNCPECFPELPDLLSRLKRILRDLRSKPDARTIRSAHLFAVVPVAHITSLRSDAGIALTVYHDREKGDESHCGIWGLKDVAAEERNALQLAIGSRLAVPPVSVRELER